MEHCTPPLLGQQREGRRFPSTAFAWPSEEPAITDFVNVLLRGSVSSECLQAAFGVWSSPSTKPDFRPIVIGYIQRGLAAKCDGKYTIDKLASFSDPLLQVVIATAVGSESSVHAATGYLSNMPQYHLFVKLDFANKFNKLHRDVKLQKNHNIVPEPNAFTRQA